LRKSIYVFAMQSSTSGETNILKLNIIGIIGGIIAFISLVLPWWTMAVSINGLGINASADVSVYPYQATASSAGVSITAQVSIWYGWVALVLIVIGGLLGIAGGVLRKTRTVFVAGGVLALLSITIFAVGLQNELSNQTVVSGWPTVALFSSGSFSLYYSYTTYLSYGFWLALVAGVIMLAASLKKPEISALPPAPIPPPIPPPTPPPSSDNP
jgi:hypothetical protein